MICAPFLWDFQSDPPSDATIRCCRCETRSPASVPRATADPECAASVPSQQRRKGVARAVGENTVVVDPSGFGEEPACDKMVVCA